MTETPGVTLSGFADEAAYQKTAVQQFAAYAAVGLQYYSLRLIDAGDGIKNVLKLSKSEIQTIRHLEDEYGLNVASIGSPIGKVKLKETDDGTERTYVPFAKYLDKEVKKACELAHAFETKLIRGFSFYPPRGERAADHVGQTVDQLGQIAEVCLRSDLTFGVEVEMGTVGNSGEILAEIHRQVNNPALLLVFDAGNLACQGFTASAILEQFQLMMPGLGWLHLKDYKRPAKMPRDEKELFQHFVPLGMGDCGYETLFRELAEALPKLDARLRRRGIPGVFVELESHLLTGGQLESTTGPDGLGVALRAACRVLDYVGLGYHLRDFDDLRAARPC